ncbi:hypothetical protein [Peribacillus glennii]|uniref:hypothetical protein n=1 Tax=Peribacillus glennii TaxID=2303991 RepID=UPI0018F1759F|nr:hypothetical protein [Peribacillus glennii]
MGIRKADLEDWKQISSLLTQLEYPDTEQFIKDKVETLLMETNEELLVLKKMKRFLL